MLYIITLTYVRPIEEVNAHLQAHRQWLAEHCASGRILVAGPREDHRGGVVLAHGASRAEVDAILTQDPFVIHGLVGVSVESFEPALRADAFSATWAAHAKAIAA